MTSRQSTALVKAWGESQRKVEHSPFGPKNGVHKNKAFNMAAYLQTGLVAPLHHSLEIKLLPIRVIGRWGRKGLIGQDINQPISKRNTNMRNPSFGEGNYVTLFVKTIPMTAPGKK